MNRVPISDVSNKTSKLSTLRRTPSQGFQLVRLLAGLMLALLTTMSPCVLRGQDMLARGPASGIQRLAPVSLEGAQASTSNNVIAGPAYTSANATSSTAAWPAVPTPAVPNPGSATAAVGVQSNRLLPAAGTFNLAGTHAGSGSGLPGDTHFEFAPDAGDCQVCNYTAPGEVCPRCGRVHALASAGKTYPTVKLSGLAQIDAGWIGQDTANRALLGDIQDGADFRRARLGAKGDLSEKLSYLIEFDFAFAQRLNITDAYLDIHDVPWLGTIRIGRWRLPFNMDALTSVREMTFLERSLPFTFAPFRQIGAGFQGITDDETSTWAVSVFRFPVDQFGGNVGDNGGYSTVGRITHAIPLGPREQGSVLHFGGAYSLIDPANDHVRYATAPEIGIGETGGGVPAGVPSVIPPFVDTGILDVAHVNLFDFELAMTAGPWHAQSEVTYAVVEQTTGGTLVFPAVYAQLGYLLTGESRPYNWHNAVLGRIVPTRSLGEGGPGAWELAVRGSTIDLTDRGINGGILTDVSGGLNWYLNANAKIQLNYIHAFLDRPSTLDSNADIVALRTQVDF